MVCCTFAMFCTKLRRMVYIDNDIYIVCERIRCWCRTVCHTHTQPRAPIQHCCCHRHLLFELLLLLYTSFAASAIRIDEVRRANAKIEWNSIFERERMTEGWGDERFHFLTRVHDDGLGDLFLFSGNENATTHRLRHRKTEKSENKYSAHCVRCTRTGECSICVNACADLAPLVVLFGSFIYVSHFRNEIFYRQVQSTHYSNRATLAPFSLFGYMLLYMHN